MNLCDGLLKDLDDTITYSGIMVVCTMKFSPRFLCLDNGNGPLRVPECNSKEVG